jgi:hypothetical protein
VQSRGSRFQSSIIIIYKITTEYYFFITHAILIKTKTNLPLTSHGPTLQVSPFYYYLLSPSPSILFLFPRYTLFSSPTACILSFSHSLKKEGVGLVIPFIQAPIHSFNQQSICLIQSRLSILPGEVSFIAIFDF